MNPSLVNFEIHPLLLTSQQHRPTSNPHLTAPVNQGELKNYKFRYAYNTINYQQLQSTLQSSNPNEIESYHPGPSIPIPQKHPHKLFSNSTKLKKALKIDQRYISATHGKEEIIQRIVTASIYDAILCTKEFAESCDIYKQRSYHHPLNCLLCATICENIQSKLLLILLILDRGTCIMSNSNS